MNIHFITFGDSIDSSRIPAFHRIQSAERICDQIMETGWVNSAKFYTLEIIKNNFATWYKNNIDFILNNQRGCGYWIWKPFIIAATLKSLNEGDILIYADAGYEISNAAQKRFDEYILLTQQYDLLAFDIEESIEKWTKSDLLDYFGVLNNQTIAKEQQIQSGLIFIKNNIQSLSYINFWLSLSIINNHYLIDDTNSNNDLNSPVFIENRHDQSIFSLILRINKFGIILPDESYTPDLFNQGKYNAAFPFQCLRNPSGTRMIPK